MSHAQRMQTASVQLCSDGSIAAPVLGWNARDPIAAMKRGYAYQLDNWVPRAGYVELRRGYIGHVTGFAEAVESLLPYRAGSTEKVFACSGDSIYDVTSSGSLGAAVQTGLSNARLQSVNIANDAGAFMFCVNGADAPRTYNGSAWATQTITGSSGSITLTPSSIDNVMLHKRRLFLSEANTRRIWYLGTNAISGSAGLLDLGPVFAKGGAIVGMGVWSAAGGVDTPLAVAAFVTNQGEVAVYRGNDPSNADDWALDGVYQIGKPLGQRAVIQTSSDLVFITYDGAIPLSVVKSADRLDDRTSQKNRAITSRIQSAFSSAAVSYASKFGWQATSYPSGNLIIINVPITELGRSYQFVQNTQTGGWCRFKGINSICWAYANGQIYFGGQDGANVKGVYRWDTGGSDNGAAITADCVTAFEPFGSRGRIKEFNAVKPILRAPSSVAPQIDLVVDYQVPALTNTPDVESVSGSGLWGDGLWGVAQWTSSNPLRLDWAGIGAVGYVGAARVRVVANPAAVSGVYPPVRCEIIGFDIRFIQGASF